ncbi:MAG: HAMP domain-containing histidine kinase [Alistipes senegalensis]|nr:HAMP domain-containing histidine kinase [Alistipes senegalensis]
MLYFGLILIIIILCIKIYIMKKSVREIMDELAYRLKNSTNTLISISSCDEDICRLANSLNVQLKELRKKRHIYEQGDRELKEAITNISHDLRTPLTAIIGYLDLMENVGENSEILRYTAMIRNRTDIMKQLTEELFRYSVIASVQEANVETVCINDVLEETLAGFYGAVTQSGIVPDIEISEVRTEKELDKSALSRIFSNIIQNALKYSDGDFSVKLSDDGIITFSNSAKKLTSIDVEQLFDRFYTVENAGNSTGLGLSIAKLLTQRMGGEISAKLTGERLVINLYF